KPQTCKARSALPFFQKALLDSAIGVDPAVAQERPVAAHFLDAAEVDLSQKDLFAVGGGLCDHNPEGIGDEGRSPELDACTTSLPRAGSVARTCANSLPCGGALPGNTGRRLMPDAVHRGDVNAIRDGVTALHGAPGVALRRADRLLFARMPANRRGIEQHRRAPERRQPRRLRIPLVPADERSDAPDARIKGPKAEVARGEVELLVVGGIVRDVH